MTELRDILKTANVCRALIIDDAYDPVPLASDLSIEMDEWSQLFDDILEEDEVTLKRIFPAYEEMRADDLRDSNEFVGLLWEKRGEINKKLLDVLC